jgi:hypothetical protein
VWIDKQKIVPGDNLRKSIFRDGLDKADIALLFFTESSLKSSWVDREIKHVLREEGKKGNDFDLNKIISIFDSQKTYESISERYPELTDDLLHLMPKDYTKIQFGQLITAIWSKYLSLQGGDVETQKQLLAKEKEIFQREKEVAELKSKLQELKYGDKENKQEQQFEAYLKSGEIDGFIAFKDKLLANNYTNKTAIPQLSSATAFGLVTYHGSELVAVSEKGKAFFQWHILHNQ